jgi:D-glycero-alpha-D-manno-heptose 1-phosphate guanylyltransferase
MKMLVLAGGSGTRLQSVLVDVPKALAPVGPVPFLYIQIEHWIEQGLRSFVFLLHHQADLIIKFFETEKNGVLRDCKVQWLIEPTPMDTGGAVAYAVQQLALSGDFLLTNADTWLGAGVQDIARSAAPSMAILRLGDASRYGQVQFNDQFNVTVFSEKNCSQGPGWINAGLCLLNTDFFKNWDGQPFSLERISLPELAGRGGLKAVPLQTDFIDIGIPDDYFRFCHWIESGRRGKLCS